VTGNRVVGMGSKIKLNIGRCELEPGRVCANGYSWGDAGTGVMRVTTGRVPGPPDLCLILRSVFQTLLGTQRLFLEADDLNPHPTVATMAFCTRSEIHQTRQAHRLDLALWSTELHSHLRGDTSPLGRRQGYGDGA
jgi:hypothetical protein